MKTYKFYVKNQIFYIEDSGGDLYTGLTSKVVPIHDKTDSPVFSFDNVKRLGKSSRFHIDNIQDVDGNPFTLANFITFLEDSLGEPSGTGGSTVGGATSIKQSEMITALTDLQTEVEADKTLSKADRDAIITKLTEARTADATEQASLLGEVQTLVADNVDLKAKADAAIAANTEVKDAIVADAAAQATVNAQLLSEAKQTNILLTALNGASAIEEQTLNIPDSVSFPITATKPIVSVVAEDPADGSRYNLELSGASGNSINAINAFAINNAKLFILVK